MRIGLVSPYSLTIPGGVQAQVLGLARVLRRLGHEARVLGPCDGPPPASFVTPLGDSIPTAANGSVAPLAPDPSAALRTIRALRDEDFEVIHLHEPLAPGPTLTTLLMKPGPLVGTFHAAGRSSTYKYLRPLVAATASRLDVRCAVSPDARALAVEYLGGTYEMVFNGIEVPRFAEATPTPGGERAIFFIGRHEPRKGLRVLLEAHAHLPGDVELWVGSDGPETDELRADFTSERIHWLGRISDTEVAQRMRGAAVACFPSLGGESFGVVLLEAMAAGTAVVASDLPGYRNAARPGQDAVFVTPGDAKALAGALTDLLVDRDRAAELVASGRERVAGFSMEALANRYLEIYDRLVPGRIARR